ncbi:MULTISPECIES: Zn-ribbon domain-containing OB-fold protein [unclassified Rhodococcus (in: high G+C Gram-positive bacteria)]|uniref:Zn-ribbon domain-containing OB-fold protein n=1 Tax=unclassified Rhodococcus (in: high G+C Gram-positive bacteria) TaxID=192944 RepID=UPI001639BFEA|nr:MULTISPECIES: OB-fold domain-containing protein [unclassified Rhodococcus (in: high G+C Gram-positive bacteria)]MBC2644595.1 OB-fold domain-containing protein [Rhodococcus sp. 3A]MBC2890961.1 OB-fold domain-containing protein [Rhodococcus sp. 4CII]MBC2897694.1 OB-fold domain-containing protein [Rhodococcus sp. 4CII]
MPAFPIHRDAATAAFLDGAAAGRFLIVRDQSTGAHHAPQFDVSIDPERYALVPAAGTGEIVSWSVVHRRSPDGPARTVVGIVQLDEGPWWWTEISGVDPSSDLIGTRVRVAFARPDGETDAEAETIPYFTVKT